MPKRKTLEDVINHLKIYDVNHECTLLSDKYVNNTTPLIFQCNICGEPFKRDWSHLQKRKTYFSCPHCSCVNSGKLTKYTLNDVQEFLKDQDAILLSTEYINTFTPLKLQCKICGDIFYRDFQHIQNSQSLNKCEKCARHHFEADDYKVAESITEFSRRIQSSVVHNWKQKWLEKYNYECDITHQKNLIAVHHLDKTYINIVKESYEELSKEYNKDFNNFTTIELVNLRHLIKKRHDEEAEGVVILETYHTLFHRLYGYHHTSKEQYYEFKQKILNGEIKI